MALWVCCALVAGARAQTAPAERWYRLDWQGAPAGWTHEIDRPGAAGAVHRIDETVVRMTREGTALSVWSHSEFTPPGPGTAGLFETETAIGAADTIRMRVRFDADSLRGERSASGQGHRLGGGARFSLPRSPRLLRPDQVDSLLAAFSGNPGDSLAFDAFVPELGAVVAFHARYEGTGTPAGREAYGQARHWRIRPPQAPALESVEWRDRTGDLIQSDAPAMGMTETRVTREEALAISGGAEVLATTFIHLNRPLESPRPYRRVLYRISFLAGCSPWRPPSDSMFRRVSGSDSVMQAESVRLPIPVAGSHRSDPLSEEERGRALRSTLLLESGDPAVQAAAREAIGSEQDPWRRAVLLEKFVARRIEKKDLRVLFASAAHTLASREGDCTEHAVLLAALARSVGLPSRVVAGLVAIGDTMGYHLWTEVDAGGGWIGLDAALDRAPVDGRYVPLAASDLSEDTIAPLSLGVLGSLGRIHLAVLEAETDKE